MSYIDLDNIEILDTITDNFLPNHLTDNNENNENNESIQTINVIETNDTKITDNIPQSVQRHGTTTSDTTGYYPNEMYNNMMSNN